MPSLSPELLYTLSALVALALGGWFFAVWEEIYRPDKDLEPKRWLLYQHHLRRLRKTPSWRRPGFALIVVTLFLSSLNVFIIFPLNLLNSFLIFLIFPAMAYLGSLRRMRRLAGSSMLGELALVPHYRIGGIAEEVHFLSMRALGPSLVVWFLGCWIGPFVRMQVDEMAALTVAMLFVLIAMPTLLASASGFGLVRALKAVVPRGGIRLLGSPDFKAAAGLVAIILVVGFGAHRRLFLPVFFVIAAIGLWLLGAEMLRYYASFCKPGDRNQRDRVSETIMKLVARGL